MSKRLNVRDILSNHTQYKSGLLKTYKYLERQNENNLKLMKSLVPRFIENIKKGNIEDAWKILKKNWDYKKK